MQNNFATAIPDAVLKKALGYFQQGAAELRPYLDALTPIVPLAHLHLHENFGDRDSHLPLFTGPARDNPSGIQGMVERLERRGFAGCAILEQWPQPPSLLVEARDGLARMAARGGRPPCS